MKHLTKAILITATAMVAYAAAYRTQAFGVAMCIAKNDDGIGEEYFLQYGGTPKTSGWDTREAAIRLLFHKYGTEKNYSCTLSPSELMATGGHWIIVESGPVHHYKGFNYVSWGLGIGTTSDGALQDAVKDLRNRNWSWIESKHGYSISQQGTFGY